MYLYSTEKAFEKNGKFAYAIFMSLVLVLWVNEGGEIVVNHFLS